MFRYLSVLLLAGCAATVTPMPLEGGRQGHMVECRGAASWPNCYKQAGELCPSGYKIEDRMAVSSSGVEVLRLVVSCVQS